MVKSSRANCLRKLAQFVVNRENWESLRLAIVLMLKRDGNVQVQKWEREERRKASQSPRSADLKSCASVKHNLFSHREACARFFVGLDFYFFFLLPLERVKKLVECYIYFVIEKHQQHNVDIGIESALLPVLCLSISFAPMAKYIW